MSPARLVGGLIALLVGGLVGPAGALANGERIVQVEGAEIRSHPGGRALVTDRLPRGTPVHVLDRRDGGWLEIRPPKGSFSWIEEKNVGRLGQALQVVGQTPVTMRLGTSLDRDRPSNVEGISVQPGTQLYPLTAQPVLAENGRWWPVMASAAERRFIHESALREPAAGPIQAGVPGAPPSQGADALFHQAQEAERSGNIAEARRLYSELARVAADETLRIFALNRSQFLAENPRSGAPPAPAWPASGRPAPAAGGTIQPAVRPGMSPPPASRPPSYPVGTAPAAGVGPVPGHTPVSSGPGRLERAAFFIDGRQAYALVSSQGLPRLYVTAQDGVNLEPFVNRNVELIGPMAYRGDLRTNYMRAGQVIPLR